MKLLIPILLLCLGAKAQTCVSVDCKDTTRYPTASILLKGIATAPQGIRFVKWTVVSGSATLTNSDSATATARGFRTKGFYVFRLSATSNNGVVASALDSTYYIPKHQ